MLASTLFLAVAALPDQGAAGMPPQTRISQDFLQTAQFAVKNGFGDPRGGEYREATIRRHSIWGRSEDGTAHGWLKKDGRFVAWNGLTYRPVSVGAKLDLAEDLSSAFKEGQFIPFPMGPQIGANAAALLLLLGEDESARIAWRSESGEQFLKRFLSETFNQAVAAHRGGDDGEANRQALWIKESVPRFEEFADSRWPRKTLREASLPRFDFLENVGRLADDSSRRLKNPKGRIDLAVISALPKERRIAALIAALDEVETPESGQTGGDFPSSRSLVMALAKEGTAAIPALLDCLEKDDRLTRSVRYYRNIHPHWYFQSVKSVATAAFGEIYQIYDFKRPDGSPWDIADYRAFYAEMGDRSPVEVQYRRLADDRAGERVWIEAANWLSERQSVRREGGWITAPPEGDRSPLKGESLRNRNRPSITDLIVKRIGDLSIKDTPGANNSLKRNEAMRMAMVLTRWDPKASFGPMRSSTRFYIENGSGEDESGMRTYADAVNWLLKNESPSRFVQTLSEFEKSFGRAKNRRGGSTLGESLRNFVRFSNRPEVQATAERLFRGKLSPPNFGYQSFVDLTDLGMLSLKGYRAQFERLLRDETVIGRTSYQDGGIAYLIEDELDTLYYMDAQEEDAPASGKSQAIRACDLAASVMVRYEHMPAFRLFWSPEAKDAAIARMLSEFDKGTPLKAKGSLPQEKVFYRLQ